MAKITEFDRANLPMLREAINKALAAVGTKFGVSLQAGNASYSGPQASFKLVAMIGEGKTIADARNEKMAADLQRYLKSIAPDLNTKTRYILNGVEHKIVGFNVRARSTPMIIRNRAGKQFKCSIEVLQRAKKAGAK